MLLHETKAQDTTLTAQETALLDSMFQNDEFLKLLDDSKISYVDFSAGFSNGVFSLKNNSLNAGQAETKNIYYTTSASYFHKSGFGAGADIFFANDQGRMVGYQYAINPFYNYQGKKIAAGISYTRFINGTGTSFSVNPYKNDFYANLELEKPWYKPAVAFGFSSGKYREIYDSVFTYDIPGPTPPRTVRITDTIKTKLNYFSLSLSVSHKWSYKNLFEKKDQFEIRPAFMLNFSNQYINISHSNSLASRRPVVQKLLKAVFGDGTLSEPFRLQSLAFLLDMSYSIGRFDFAPQLYSDYYFPQTSGNRFSFIYSMVISCAF